MDRATLPFDSFLAASTFFAPLPGPDRKRTLHPYHYQVIFCTPDPEEVGCIVLWEVTGGRTSYQVALERGERGELRWHCTCADAIYRAENEGRHCKHVRGLVELGRPSQARCCDPALARGAYATPLLHGALTRPRSFAFLTLRPGAFPATLEEEPSPPFAGTRHA